jgi:hypothetical protein
MNDLPFTEYLILAPFVLCLVGAFVSWGFAAYYIFKTIVRFRPDRQWGRYVPYSIFFSSFFTEEGNFYRVKLLRSSGLFVLFVALGGAIGFGIKTLTGQ